MIEVMFGESEAGAMKVALHNDKALGGDVVCLGSLLDIGDIQKSVFGKYRANLLYNLYYQEQYGEDSDSKVELKRLCSVYSNEYDRLVGYLKKGEKIRVWYSSAPYSLCGLLWLCCELRGLISEVSVVKLPSVTVKRNSAVSYSSWGEVEPNRFKYFLKKSRVLTSDEISLYAHYWEGLKRENAPLRAVLNGSVISVPASFYDFLIFKNLDDTPIKEAMLIGKILSENRIGVGDFWYACRIEKFITQGRIKVIENSEQKYERILTKN